MVRMTATLLLAFGLFLTGVAAQQPGGPPDRRERVRQREPGQPGPLRAEGRRPPISPVLAALDANGDGAIDADEIAGAATALKKLDKDGDGKLTRQEYLPGPPGGPGGLAGRGAVPPGEPGEPPGRRPAAGRADFESSPLARDEAEKKVLDVLDDMDRNQRQGMMSVPRDDGRFLRVLTESLAARNVVEIGTSHGYSAIWLCLALRATGGRLTTFEIDAQRAELARKNFQRAGLDKLVTLIEGDAHQEVKQLKDPIDILFLDADKQGYIDYLEKLLPLVRPGGLIVAHNMDARQADPRYVKAITTNPELETLFVNVGASGIGLTLKKR